ncbi:hypothetical protein PPYR_04234 [Photinus pyralis]|uniref:Homeobox domain-containing protein n=1 Tax=Photinus pyralis TaxID=7054 RepID=A0A5N4AXS5_PHOPY|nr:homeobox protein DBX1 [Photinus pyralis]KAB0802048.1 hypothetical protein PPYR_04234 [Photinus pyralis]
MSFRIEDILKTDFSSRAKSPPKFSNSGEKVSVSSKNVTSDVRNYSILQQTLLSQYNSINPFDYYSCEQFYSAGTCDKIGYFPSNYPDYCYPNAYQYLPIYSRSRHYQSYESLSHLYQMASKRKGGQVRFTSIQTEALEKRFVSHKYLSPEDRKILADSLKLTDKQVKTWFQNRRAKWRRSNSTSSNCTDTEYEKLDETDSEKAFCDGFIA